MDNASDPKPLPFSWIFSLVLSLNLNFLITFFYNQFRRVPYPNHDFTGQTIIVTGGNIGLGLEAARHFVRLNAAKVILACRSTERGETAKADIERSLTLGRSGSRASGHGDGVIEVWPLDLGSFASVRAFCRRADTQLARVDAVVENASVAMVAPEGTLAEGYECTITVNVLSTFLMALLLLPTLRRTAARFNTQPRLTIVSSDAHFMSNFNERKATPILDAFKSPTVPSDRYQTSKLLQILLVRELAQHLADPAPAPGPDKKGQAGAVILNTLTPGFCRTALFRDNRFPASAFIGLNSWLLGRSAEAGARTIVHAAAPAGRAETHGKWLDTCDIREPSAYVRSEEGARMQRRVYEELLELLERVEPGVTKII